MMVWSINVEGELTGGKKQNLTFLLCNLLTNGLVYFFNEVIRQLPCARHCAESWEYSCDPVN